MTAGVTEGLAANSIGCRVRGLPTPIEGLRYWLASALDVSCQRLFVKDTDRADVV